MSIGHSKKPKPFEALYLPFYIVVILMITGYFPLRGQSAGTTSSVKVIKRYSLPLSLEKCDTVKLEKELSKSISSYLDESPNPDNYLSTVLQVEFSTYRKKDTYLVNAGVLFTSPSFEEYNYACKIAVAQFDPLALSAKDPSQMISFSLDWLLPNDLETFSKYQEQQVFTFFPYLEFLSPNNPSDLGGKRVSLNKEGVAPFQAG